MKKAAVPILVAVILLTVAVVTEAQQPMKVPRIGYLSNTDAASDSARAEGIRLALRELGYIEGQTIAVEYRYAEGRREREPGLAAELVRLKVDIIVVASGDVTIQAAKNATKTIPIVMMGLGSDPVRAGHVESLARPGGNVTGLTTLNRELGGKRLELFKRSGTQTFPCRGSLRSGQSAQFTRGERASPSRRACAKVDYSTLADTSGGRLREGLCCAKQAAPGWTLRARRGRGNAC
jgi:hypothetical protein